MKLDFLYVGLGGFLGACSRYALSLLFSGSPIATVVANLSGCFLIGVISTLLNHYFPSNQTWRLLTIVGLLGGFTTFSAFGLESMQLLTQGQLSNAAYYIASQLIGGIALVVLGSRLASIITN